MFIGFSHCLYAFLERQDKYKDRDSGDCTGVFTVDSVKSIQG